MGMGAIVALSIIVLLALLIVQLGTNALKLSGMPLSVARFQAASAFFGVGFTTKEAELVVDHPVRRRIILQLIITGNVGLMSAAATMIVAFVQNNDSEGLPQGLLLVFVLLGALLLAAILNLRIVRKPMDMLMRYSLERAGLKRAVDYELLLKVKQGFCVSDLEISEGHPLADLPLYKSRPADQGIVVLGIYHRAGTFEGAPRKDAVISAGDTVMVYGNEDAVSALVEGNPDPDDALEKIDERIEKEE